jgi:uncharacterized linocin/CFP29 family protein
MDGEQISWGDAEWSRIRAVVHDEALRSRVAASFLPLYGPLPQGLESVPVNKMKVVEGLGGPDRLEVDDYTTERLVSVSVNVHLKNHMLADPDLTVAIDLFRRAANIVARVEDAVIFKGMPLPPSPPEEDEEAEGKSLPDVYRVSGPTSHPGLLASARRHAVATYHKEDDKRGQAVFDAIVKAVLKAEAQGFHRPFALVLGHALFTDLNRPIPHSMVLPRDAVPPFTEGPLLRSSELPPESGLLISLQGNAVEIVVPSDISVRYLQADLDGGHVFRVSQRFLLRVKDKGAIVAIERKPSIPEKK